STKVYIHDADGNVARQYEVGIPAVGNNTIDLTNFNITLGLGEYVSIQGLSYNSSLTVSDRFYDELTDSFVTTPYYFQFIFDRVVSDEEVNRIEVLETNVDNSVSTNISFNQNGGTLNVVTNNKNLRTNSTQNTTATLPSVSLTADEIGRA